MNYFGSNRLYKVELWSRGGTLLADISAMCQQREYILTRNDAEQFTFVIDLTAFENYCTSIGVNPRSLIEPYVTDVKLKRNGQYLFVVQVVGLEFDFQPDDSGVNPETGSLSKNTTITETVTVTCTGYLNVLADRYITYDYIDFDPAHIAADLLYRTQDPIITPGGAIGITVPANFGYLTGVIIDEVSLVRQQIKQEMQLLAELPDSPFDFAIDATKTFYTYPMVGSQRNDITLTYGGPGSNVVGLYHQRAAAGALFNQVFGIGSGYGTTQLTSTQNNTASQVDYLLRQAINMYSHVKNQNQLDLYAQADVTRDSSLLEIPQLITTGRIFTDAKYNQVRPFFSIGDRLPLSFPTHPFLSSLDGQYFRIESLDVKIDDSDFEYEITVTMDSYGLNISI